MTQLGALVHPSDFMKPEWLLTRESLHMGGLIVEHHIEPADEIQTSGLSHHLLCVHLSSTTRQVTRFEGQEYDGAMSQMDLWFLPAQQSGFWHWESSDECLLFVIDPHLLQRVALETECFSSSQIELLPTVQRNDPQLNAIATLFLHELTAIGTDTRLYQESLTNLLAIHILRHYCGFEPKLKQYQGGLSKHKLQQTIDYIQVNLDQKLSLEAIAQNLNLSVYHFCHLFKQSVGIAPYKYVLQQRVERAKQLLKDEESAIAEIAYRVGISNQSHFTAQFRKIVGVTPKQYRDSA